MDCSRDRFKLIRYEAIVPNLLLPTVLSIVRFLSQRQELVRVIVDFCKVQATSSTPSKARGKLAERSSEIERVPGHRYVLRFFDG